MTNEELRKLARRDILSGDRKVLYRISVPDWGVVQVTESRAFVEAVIEIPLQVSEAQADGSGE